MKTLVLLIMLCCSFAASFSQSISHIENGESMSSVRSSINSAIDVCNNNFASRFVHVHVDSLTLNSMFNHAGDTAKIALLDSSSSLHYLPLFVYYSYDPDVAGFTNSESRSLNFHLSPQFRLISLFQCAASIAYTSRQLSYFSTSYVVASFTNLSVSFSQPWRWYLKFSQSSATSYMQSFHGSIDYYVYFLVF